MALTFRLPTKTYYSAWLVLLTLCLFVVPSVCRGAILHLELGVANYGPAFGDGSKRYAVLDQTLMDLVEKYGDSGVVYLNDLNPQGLDLAAAYARSWLLKHGLPNIQIIQIAGDYTKLALPQVQTANLSNPDTDQIPLPGKTMQENLNITGGLERVADHSKTGLRISSYYHYPHFYGLGVLMSLVKNCLFISTGQNGYAYNAPNGVNRINNLPIPDKSLEFYLVPKARFCQLPLGG